MRNDSGNPPALEATQRIVMREGELAAIDLPIDIYTFDSPTVVQIATAPLTPTDDNIWKGTRATFLAIDNNTLDGVRVTRLTANGRVIEIVVIDDDGLSLTASPTSISEGGGIVQLTVTRPAIDLQLPLVVQIETSDRTRLNVPASVTIPAGQTSLTFIAMPSITLVRAIPISYASPQLRLAWVPVLYRFVSSTTKVCSFPFLRPSFGAGRCDDRYYLAHGRLGAPLVVTLPNDRRIELPCRRN